MAWPKGKPRKPKSGVAGIAAKIRGSKSDTGGLEGNARGRNDALDPQSLAGDFPSVAAEQGQAGKGTETKAKVRPSVTPPDVPLATLAQWTDLLFNAHATVAAFTAFKEAELDKLEAAKLAEAATNVARWYAVPTIAQKTMDWINLISVAHVVYTPRVMAFNLRRLAEKRAAANMAARGRGQIVPFQGPPSTGGGAPPAPPQGPVGAEGGAPPAPPPSAASAPTTASKPKPGRFRADEGLVLEGTPRGVDDRPLTQTSPELGLH